MEADNTTVTLSKTKDVELRKFVEEQGLHLKHVGSNSQSRDLTMQSEQDNLILQHKLK